MKIIKAENNHLSEVARLFNLYRQFYKCEDDLSLAKQFIADRIQNDESTIFLAVEEGKGLGFVQLYPSFCSVGACPVLVLYDLFVDESARGKKVAETLMNRATEYAREIGAKRLDLSTAKDNFTAQALYKKLGYKHEDEEFYFLSLVVD